MIGIAEDSKINKLTQIPTGINRVRVNVSTRVDDTRGPDTICVLLRP